MLNKLINMIVEWGCVIFAPSVLGWAFYHTAVNDPEIFFYIIGHIAVVGFLFLLAFNWESHKVRKYEA